MCACACGRVCQDVCVCVCVCARAFVWVCACKRMRALYKRYIRIVAHAECMFICTLLCFYPCGYRFLFVKEWRNYLPFNIIRFRGGGYESWTTFTINLYILSASERLASVEILTTGQRGKMCNVNLVKKEIEKKDKKKVK